MQYLMRNLVFIKSKSDNKVFLNHTPILETTSEQQDLAFIKLNNSALPKSELKEPKTMIQLKTKLGLDQTCQDQTIAKLV